jgi:hypothetical protein
VLDQFKVVFTPPSTLPPPRPEDHSIPLTDGAQSVSLRPYRYNPTLKSEIESQIADMLDKGWIQVSTSPYSSLVLLVRKKTGDWRLCVDFRRLNVVTKKNKYPLPIIKELLEELQGSSWFTSLDLCSGFHQSVWQLERSSRQHFKPTIATMSIESCLMGRHEVQQHSKQS